jgi:6-phosphogluconate dehydrogenase
VSDKKQQFGLVGLAVMGENLALNVESKGFSVAVWNRTTSKVDNFIKGRAKGKNFVGCHSPQELARALEKPRKVMLMVKAGAATDAMIDQLVPVLDKGDLIIDGGNSYFKDTERRSKALAEKGLLFIGTGVSGGEEGALKGPSIMPGGQKEAYDLVGDLLCKVSAQVDGTPCCTYIGPRGAGHYVKMVHNGIEYGDMQLISEAYHLMKEGLGMSHDEMHQVFAEWNEGKLDSYLIEITRDILGFRDEDGSPLVEKILDTAGQKGTGKWTAISALDMGIPLTLISEAVLARFLSALKDERVAASRVLSGPEPVFKGDKASFVNDIHDALYASKIISYTQGFMLMQAASQEYGWDLNFGSIALMWREGCVIRSVFLGDIKNAYEKNPSLSNLLLDPYFKGEVMAAQPGWRRVIARAVEMGIPVPAMSIGLAFYDGYRHERLPANMLQAQRDYFGAHTYERVDRPRGQSFHTNWTGRGGDVTATSYQA